MRILLAATCIAVLAVLGSGASADAASTRVNDPVDAYGLPPKVEAAKDIRAVRFTNGKRRITAVVTLRGLSPKSSGWIQLRLSTPDYSQHAGLTAVRRPNGAQPLTSFGLRKCSGARGRYSTRRDEVRLSLPHRCVQGGSRHAWQLSVLAGALPLKGANAWDVSREVVVRYD